MHITILADAIDNQNAGVHYYLKNLIENLLKIDNKNKYSFIHCQENLFFNDKEHYIVPQTKGPGTETIRRFHKIPKLIKKIKSDAVWQPCHIGPFNIPPEIKRIVTIHDLTPILFPQFHTHRGKIIHKLLLGKTLKNADLILTSSKTTKNDIQKLYKTNAKITITPLGVDKPQTNVKPYFSEPYILYLGTIEPRKNLEMLIDAFLELDLPQKLVLAGTKGWKNSRILEKAKNPKIILRTNISEQEKASLYAHADAFVYPSIYEGFGLPPLEAMSYGIPVICSTGGSLSKLYSNHALMFDPKDKETLKSHLKNFKNAPRSKEFASNFTWENTAKLTLKALNQI
ncbi:MAG: glycosyltransferase family 1 protein [Nitrospirota bacterium]